MGTVRVDGHHTGTAGDHVVSSCTPDPVVAAVIADTRALGDPHETLIPVEQAGFLTTLAKTMAPRTVIDIGTFTGLSALCLARGLAPGGLVYTCDVTGKWIHLARKHWDAARITDRIRFVPGPARGTVPEIVGPDEADLVFVNADPPSYPSYVDLAARLLRPGGLLILNKVLRDDGTATLREVNAKLAVDERFETVLLPFADGVTLARKF